MEKDLTFEREISGEVQFASLMLRVEPMHENSGNEVVFDISKEQIPQIYYNAIEDGIRDALMTGVLGNYAVINTKIIVIGGEARDNESSDMAFRSAAVMAVRNAVNNSNPILLEPIMLVEVSTPEEHLGDVMGDLNSRRGRVRDIQASNDLQTVHADVPLAEVFGYATTLRSLTKGRASYSMEPQAFEPVPTNMTDRILNR